MRPSCPPRRSCVRRKRRPPAAVDNSRTGVKPAGFHLSNPMPCSDGWGHFSFNARDWLSSGFDINSDLKCVPCSVAPRAPGGCGTSYWHRGVAAMMLVRREAARGQRRLMAVTGAGECQSIGIIKFDDGFPVSSSHRRPATHDHLLKFATSDSHPQSGRPPTGWSAVPEYPGCWTVVTCCCPKCSARAARPVHHCSRHWTCLEHAKLAEQLAAVFQRPAKRRLASAVFRSVCCLTESWRE